MPSTLDEIKEKLDIVQVVSEYLQLKKVGANYRALCPFHSEKTPSFYVSSSRQIFKCFGCGKSGDIFRFIMDIEGVEFKEALEILAKRAGVEIKKEPIQKRTERQRQYEICELATKFFEAQLNRTKTGKEAENYLLSRGIFEESIKEWRLGYAPNTWQGLSDFLVGKGYKREEVINAGLAIKPENELKNSYDRFRGRIMFPIFDIQGNVIGFGGRITEEQKAKFKKEKGEEPAKYINTTNTLIYDKSKVLYGLHEAKTEIRKKDETILVEGYTDVILSAQTGVKNVISTSGTVLTPLQLKILSRYNKNLTLCFDMDIAGEAATKKGIDIAQFQGFNIKIISLPENKDPADVIKENPKKWQEAVGEAKEIISFYFEQSFDRFDKNTVEGKRKISEIILPFISRAQNRIEQAYWIGELSEKLNLKEEAIWEEVRKIKNKQNTTYDLQLSATYEIGTKPEVKDQKKQIEERLLMVLLKFPQNLKKIKKVPKFSFKEGEKLFECLKEEKAPPRELADFVSELNLQFEVEGTKGEINPEKEVQFCIDSLQRLERGKNLKRITEELREAEKLPDKKKISKLLEKISKL